MDCGRSAGSGLRVFGWFLRRWTAGVALVPTLEKRDQTNVIVSQVPKVALFALWDIPARTELTYDYNYAIGDVEGKTLDCHCGAATCRGRLY